MQLLYNSHNSACRFTLRLLERDGSCRATFEGACAEGKRQHVRPASVAQGGRHSLVWDRVSNRISCHNHQERHQGLEAAVRVSDASKCKGARHSRGSQVRVNISTLHMQRLTTQQQMCLCNLIDFVSWTAHLTAPFSCHVDRAQNRARTTLPRRPRKCSGRRFRRKVSSLSNHAFHVPEVLFAASTRSPIGCRSSGRRWVLDTGNFLFATQRDPNRAGRFHLERPV